MSFYDAFKDVLNLAQKADNLELYRQLLDLNSQALNLQTENARLNEENAQLKKNKNVEDRIVRHKQPYLTLSDDDLKIKYCSVCWDTSRKLVQMKEKVDGATYGSRISFYCHNCKNHC
ncbi:MAG: hypothetical protein IKH03_04600 [Oscillospiraceae bacterium]|nr:hypothetical protein [Oscillospiraceae bacterium]